MTWWTNNCVTKEPPEPWKNEFRKLDDRVRDWHPAFGIGDSVRRNFLGSGSVGTVQEFIWRGAHLCARVKFHNRVECFFASEYTKL